MSTFTIHIDGLGDAKLSPEDVPVAEAAKYALAVEAALGHLAEARGAVLNGRPIVSFKSAEEGSCELKLNLSDAVDEDAASLIESLRIRRFGDLPRKTVIALRQMEEHANRSGRALRVRGHGQQRWAPVVGIPLATEEEQEAATFAGRTVLYGEIVRLNGERNDGSFLTVDGRRVTLHKMSDETLRMLGSKLRMRVRLTGEGVWKRDTLALEAIAPVSVELHDYNTFQTLDQLRQLPGELHEDDLEHEAGAE